MSNQKTADRSPWMTREQACEYLGIGERTLHRWMRHEGLKFYRPGGRTVRFRREDLDRFVERSKA